MTKNQNNYEIISNPFLLHKEKFGQTDAVLLNELYSCLEQKAPKKILDLGCGNGRIAKEVATNITSIEKIFAIDISKDMIIDAKSKNSHIKIDYKHVEEGKISNKIIPDDIVDVAYSVYVLMEPSNESDVLSIIKNAYNKIKPGGTYFAINSNIEEFSGKECYSYKIDTLPKEIQENDKTTTYLRIGKGNMNQDRLEIHDYYRSIEKYMELFRKAKFKNIQIKRILVPEDTYLDMKDESTTAPAYIILGIKAE